MGGVLRGPIWHFFLAMAASLALAQPARAALVNPDFQIGPDVSLDSLSAAAGNDSYIAVVTSYYLVVWRDLTTSPAPRISGALVSNTGVVSPSFFISDVAGQPQIGPVQRTRVSFDGTNFLVVWADTRPAGTGVRGAFVSLQGAVVGGADFLIAPTLNTANVNPQVLFTGDNYLVAWQDAAQSGNGTQIFFTRVTPAGVSGMPLPITPVAGHDPAQQFEFLVKGPKVPQGEALLVYQDIGDSPNATYAVRIDPKSAIVGPASGAKMFTRDFSATGLGAPIGGAFINDEYLLLASLGTQISCAVSRAWLHADGSIALSTVPFALVGEGTGLAETDFPMTFYNDVEGVNLEEFLFLRNSRASDVVYHVLMKRVSLIPRKNETSTDRDPNMEVVDDALSGGLNGAVGCVLPVPDPAQTGLVVSQYLVVWMDGRRRVADPPFQTNIYGAIIDNTQVGNEIRPYVRPGPVAAPLTGVAPLTVTFASSFSTGGIDSVNWDFGDGTSSSLFATTHVYQNSGTYLTIYSLLKAGLNYDDYFHVYAGTTDPGGAGGPPQSVGGVLGPLSPGVNNQAAISAFSATVNFAKSNADAFRVTGVLNVPDLPVNLGGTQFTFTLGANNYSFTLLDGGTFNSTSGDTPVLAFGLNSASGFFTLVSSSDSLAGALAAGGVVNATVSKQTVSIPLSVSYAGLSTNQTLQAQYTAKQGGSGKVNFVFGTTGLPGEGVFRIADATATERLTNGKTGDRINDFGLIGNITLPGGKPLVKTPSGLWRFTFGNFQQNIATSQVTLASNVYTFKNNHTTSGIISFQYNQKSGVFFLGLKGIPAEGVDPSGMALSNSLIVRADLAVSVDFDLDQGGEYQGSAFLRLQRKDVGKKKWTLR